MERFGSNVMMFYFLQNMDELKSLLLYPYTMIMSDGAPTSAHNHPRWMGAFGEILEMFVQKDHQMTLEAAVRKMTSMPAERYRLTGRGIIRRVTKPI